MAEPVALDLGSGSPADEGGPRRALPTGVPLEVWAVVALLVGAGLFLGVPVLQELPDAVSFAADGGLWESFGLLVVVLLVELGLLAGACLVLAWQLTQGDAVARVVAVVVGSSLAFGLVVGDGLGTTDGLVTALCAAGVVGCLAALPGARAFFASRRPPGGSPASVVAAEAIVVLLAAVLLATGVAYLPLASLDARLAVAGLAMIGISVACLRVRRRLGTGDPAARKIVSGLMVGYGAAVLLGTEGSFTGPLFIPLGVAASVVVLLWVPHESQALFGGESAAGGGVADEGRRAGPARQPEWGPAATGRAKAPLVAGSSGSTEPPATGPPPPAASSGPEPSRESPPGSTGPARPPSSTGPPPGHRPPGTEPRVGPEPPPWLLDRPPEGFWPPQPRTVAPRQYEVVEVDPSVPTDLHAAPALGFRFDATSWFPTVAGPEVARGAFLVSMVMFDDSPTATAFRGTSTMVVTSSRVVGVCARGESAAGRLDPAVGRVAAWHVLLDEIDWVRAEGSAEGGHVTVRGAGADRPWALLAKPRAVVEGAFRPARPADVAELVNRAKRSVV